MAISSSQAFGAAVRELRAERELSQEDAALAGGIDRAYFGHIERGTKSPTLKTIWKVSEALDTRPSELLIRTERILEL
jgi:transcriptional regulator with XRE-family HTH domain